MKKQKNLAMNIIQWILGLMLVGAFLFFILGEVLLPAEVFWERKASQTFQSEWVRVMSDGTEEVIEVPGECDTERGEMVTITTVLPQNQEDTWFCIRSLQQDLHIYVGDELRKEYSTIDTQLFGKTSTMAYVFFEVWSSDAGKELRIELVSDSAYAGTVSEIFTGDISAIWSRLYGMYAPATIIAVLMWLISIVVICYSSFARLFYKKEMELFYLGCAIWVASTWLFVESRLRQFVLPNSTMAMYMGFFMIMLLPYPCASYINIIQKRRYQKVFLGIEICVITNFVLSTALQVLNIRDFFETMGISHVIIVALIVFMAVTIGIDIKKGYIKDYRTVAIGFGGLMVAGIWEIRLVYINSSRYNGIALCIGLAFLLFTAIMKAGRDVLMVEKEKQVAIAASKSKEQFLASMSHEIRTPINTVIGMNEMILRENPNEPIQEYAHNIKSASQMLLSLINDVLDFSKIEAGRLQITESKYYLSSLLNDVIQGMMVRVRQKNLELKLEIDETLPAVLKGDEIRIKQILNNLLSNAVKYTENGSVTILAKGIRDKNGFSLQLAVKDTGIGIRKEDMDRLFDRFIRFELDKNQNVEGTGLGLSITKRLVSNMDGRIDVTSEYGKGSCFTVWIPQQIVDETPMGSLQQRYKNNEPESSEAEGRLCAPDARVLVVDDNEMNLKVIQGLLKRTQIQLDCALGGKECLQMTKSKKYDLILMDHMMPEPDGVQTLHLLREDADNLNRKTEVIVLTANAITGVEEEYRKEGFADYLAKPIEVLKLEKVLARHLDLNRKKKAGIVIDKEQGISNCGSDKVLYAQALRWFHKKGPEYLEELSQYYKQQNWKEYGSLINTITSASMKVGAVELSEKAKRQEIAAREEDAAFLQREWDAFVKEYKAVLECVEREM